MKSKWQIIDPPDMLDEDFWQIAIGTNKEFKEYINIYSESEERCLALANKTIDAINNFEYEFEQ